MARVATHSSDDALDIVQDAMMQLCVHYAAADPAEWGALFHTIVQSRIRDWYRRTRVRNRWRSWFSREPDEADPMDALPSAASPESWQQAAAHGGVAALEQTLERLPLRQQQAFLLRLWEGLDVAETARIMGCSQGSVKTHYSRAIHTLRKELEPHWP